MDIELIAPIYYYGMCDFDYRGNVSLEYGMQGIRPK